MTGIRAPLFIDDGIIFTVEAEYVIDEILIADWSKKIKTALLDEEKNIEKVILDLNSKNTLNNKELTLIARALGTGSKITGWSLYINCNKEIEEQIKAQGLSKMIACNHSQIMQLKTSRILIIDDIAALRANLRKNLEQLGYLDFQEAENGITALEIIKKLKTQDEYFDLIFSDINMPEMDGIEFLRKIKDIKKLKKHKIVMVTAAGDTENVVKCIEFGAANFIVKPVTLDVLKSKLGKI